MFITHDTVPPPQRTGENHSGQNKKSKYRASESLQVMAGSLKLQTFISPMFAKISVPHPLTSHPVPSHGRDLLLVIKLSLSYQPRILVVQLVFILSVSFLIKLFIADHDWNGIKNKSLLEKGSATSHAPAWHTPAFPVKSHKKLESYV